jgi:hypothetical protein
MTTINEKSESLTIALFVLIISGMLSYGFFFAGVVFASSPSFGRQEIADGIFDHVDKTSTSNNNDKNDSKVVVNNISTPSTKKVDPSIDIVTANYYSDGRTLNSTLWLLFPFKERPSSNDTHIVRSYGMLIDADFNNQTGPGGIDYQIEIRWQNQTWTRVLTEWSKFGFEKILDKKSNYVGFAENGERYVMISADLTTMGSPGKYKVIFYAEDVNEDRSYWKVDFTNAIPMPPPEFVISTSPSSIVLRQGEQQTIQVQVKSVTGGDPHVYLSSKPPESIEMDFVPNKLRIPSFGVATTRLNIKVSENAEPGPTPVDINMTSFFPPPLFLKTDSSDISKAISLDITGPMLTSSIEDKNIKNENITKQTTLVVSVKERLGLIEQMKGFWDEWSSVITYFVGIISGSILPRIASKIKEKRNNNKNIKKLQSQQNSND